MASVTSLSTMKENNSSAIVNVMGVGGIIGAVSSEQFDLEVRDCANYGTITYAGKGMYTSIGE